MMSKNYYNVNYAQYAVQMLPANLRVELMMSYIKAVVVPLEELHAKFSKLKDSIDYNHYSQICYMQDLINDYFDPLQRRIIVRNTIIDQDYSLFWKERLKKPVMLYKEDSEDYTPYILNSDFEIGASNIDFEIVLPIGYLLSESEEIRITNLVSQSKLASKRYRITNG